MPILKPTSILIALIVLEAVAGLSLRYSGKEGCQKYDQDKCVECRDNYHLHEHQCHKGIEGCIDYMLREQNHPLCIECDDGYFLMEDSGVCFPVTSNRQLNSTRRLQQVSSETCIKDYTSHVGKDIKDNSYFQLVDNYMLNGDYKHFITRSPVYIKSVSLEYESLDANFRIIYYGSGEGLMLCIISINILTKTIQLRSFVAIDVNRLISNCLDYSNDLECNACEAGYHLQFGNCYRRIENCLRHIRNICIECEGYSLLLQNRCVTGCKETLDTNKMRLYGDVRLLKGSLLPIIEQRYLLEFS